MNASFASWLGIGLSLAIAGCGGGGSGSGGAGGGGGSDSSGSHGSHMSGSAQGGGSPSSSTTASGTPTSSSTGTSDPFEAAREACIAKINTLRATKGRAAYGRWTAAEMCVDQEVTSDEMTGQAHGAWLSGMYTCNGSGQNECLGQGPAGIESCLDSMWGEKDQPGCSGCDACADAYNPNCPNCDFYGMTTGNVCGHYVNLSANYFTMAACGFSSLGGWDAINFQ